MVNETTFGKAHVTALEMSQADTDSDVRTLLGNVDELHNETVILSNDITSVESETETLKDRVEILEAEIDITTDIIFRSGFGNNIGDSFDYRDLYNLDLNTSQTWNDIDTIYEIIIDVFTPNITDLYQNTIELQNDANIMNQNISDLNKCMCQLENENGLLKTALT